MPRPRLLLLRALRASPLARSYATAPQPPVDPHPFLSQLNNPSPSRSGSSRLSGDDHIGPFPLPPSGTSLDRDARIRAEGKKWKEMGGTEKVEEGAKQTASLLVVLAGAALAGAVFYATGTELFATNSPTRIFEDCTERVKESPELKTLLLPPYSFHGANSTSRLQRNRRISHVLTTDSDGQERMLVRFWVEGKKLPDPDADADHVWFDTVKKWVGPAIWEDSTKPGSYVPLPTVPKEVVKEVVKPRTWAGWIEAGVRTTFGAIVPQYGTQTKDGKKVEGGMIGGLLGRSRKPRLGEYSTGEVVARLKKDPESNIFVYEELYIDIPDASSPNHYRVNIPTATQEPPRQGLDRLRFWNRSTVQSA